MKIKMDLKGLEKAINNIQDYELAKKEEIQQIVKETAFKIQANAKLRSPVDTGNLKRSISVDIAPDEMSAKIGTDVEYAPHQEFGYRTKDGKHIPAQPFLFPAYEEEKNEYQRRLEKALGDAQ